MGKVLYSIRLNSETLEKLKRLAEKENASVSEVIRRELQTMNIMEIKNE